MAAMLFVLGFGVAYAGGLHNGVTDFSGRSYDTFEIGQTAPVVADNAYESSAPGSKRMVEGGVGEVSNGITDFSGRSHDTFEIEHGLSDSRVVEGSAAGSLRKNYGAAVPGYNARDTFQIER